MRPSRRKVRRGFYLGAVLAAGMLWGVTGVFVRCLTRWGLSSMQVVVCRSAAATLLLGICFLAADRKLFRIRLGDLWLFLLLGLCSVTIFNGCYFQAILELQSMSVASVLLYTSPIFITILSAVCFRERITGWKWAAVAVNFAGCVCVSGVFEEGMQASPSGILFGIGAGVAYALYSILGRLALGRGYRPLTIVFYMWLFGFLFSLPQAGGLLAHMGQNPVRPGVCLLFGLISAVFPYLLYTTGLSHIPTATAGVLSSTEPCVASLLGVFLFAEDPTVSLGLGICGVLSSVALIAYTDRKEELL